MLYDKTLIKWVEPRAARRHGRWEARRSLRRILVITGLLGVSASAVLAVVDLTLALGIGAVSLAIAGFIWLTGFLSERAPHVVEIDESKITYGFTGEPSWWKHGELLECELSPPKGSRGYGTMTLVTRKRGRVTLGVAPDVDLGEVARILRDRGVAVTLTD